MAAVALLLLLALVDSIDGSEHRFVAYGSDLRLEAKTATDTGGHDFIWRFNTTINLVKFRPGSEPLINYKERTVFSKDNYSLLLRNVTHSDSGNYKAIISGLVDKTAAEYTISVQDPVSPVNLTVTSIDHNFCNFTVTCRTVDSQISGTFQCENKTCRLLYQTHLKDSSLKVYVEKSSIICNHSNHVSWEPGKKVVTSICESPPASNTATIVGGSVGALVVVVSIICGVLIVRKTKRSANTVYEVPQETPQHNPYANPAEMTETPSPTSTYALVQFSNPPVQLNETRTSTNPQPETIYAQVDRAAKSNSKPAAANR